MKLRAYIAALHAALFAILLGVSPAGSGSMMLLGVGKPAAGAPPAYTGPGDVAGWSSAYGYWGLRAYNAAYATALGPIVDLVDQSAANAITINAKADGSMDVAAIIAWVAAHSVTTIQVNRLYDQIGTQHLTSATALSNFGSRPQLQLNMVGGLPALFFNASDTYLTSTSAATAQAQPVTASGIIRFNTFASAAAPFTDGTFGFDPLVSLLTANVSQAFGATQTYTGVADNSFASLQSVANGASSSMSVNGTITAAGASPGANGIGSTNKLTMGAGTDAGSGYMNGYIFEMLVKAGAVSATNQGLLTTNQRAIGTGF